LIAGSEAKGGSQHQGNSESLAHGVFLLIEDIYWPFEHGVPVLVPLIPQIYKPFLQGTFFRGTCFAGSLLIRVFIE
ncbi:MAG: hypothetical protein KJ715_10940, partial [Gammaproteobacteria bacterium]|nr:hypothetical protein [Gammaproteobacteria bacterium]